MDSSSWKTAAAAAVPVAVSTPVVGASSSPAADYLDRCGALAAAAAAAGLSGMMLAVTSPPTLAAFSSCTPLSLSRYFTQRNKDVS